MMSSPMPPEMACKRTRRALLDRAFMIVSGWRVTSVRCRTFCCSCNYMDGTVGAWTTVMPGVVPFFGLLAPGRIPVDRPADQVLAGFFKSRIISSSSLIAS